MTEPNGARGGWPGGESGGGASRAAARAGGRARFWLLVAGVVALCFFAQSLDLFYTLDPANSVDARVQAIREGRPARQISLLLLGAWAAAWVLLHRSLLRLDGRLAASALLFLLIVVASIGWSDDPLLSAKRAAALLLLSVGCVAIAQIVGLEEAAPLAFWGSALVVGVSWGAELALGTFAPLDPEYRFSGTMHAIVQGVYCACLTLAGASLARRAGRRARGYAIAAWIGFAFLLLTKSRASLAAVVAGLAVYFLLTSARARYWLLIASTAAAIAAVPLILVDSRTVAPLWAMLQLGRSEDVATLATLTGRTELWHTLQQYLLERPLLGYGYGGFWTPERLTALTRREGWAFGSAHSQYVEIVLSVGVIGLVLFCGTGLAALWKLIAGYWRFRADGQAFGAALLVLAAVNMVANSLPLEPSVPMVSCLTIVVGLAVVHGRNGTAPRR